MKNTGTQKNLTQSLQDIFNLIDPVNLGPGQFAPQNEYMPEITELAKFIEHKANGKKLEVEIYRILQEFFGEATLINIPDLKMKIEEMAKLIREREII